MAGSTQSIIYITVLFSLIWGELSTMSTIYDTKGEGWNKVPNIERYFHLDNLRDDNIAQAPITTSHQYKENLILLMTVSEIKKIVLGKNMQKF
jgi:hypothetical protein